jgi:hypothetical protein
VSRDRLGWRSLRRKSEFTTIYATGVRLVGRLFVLYMYPGDDLARAVVASRKIGGAVVRNRAKRLLRASVVQAIEEPADSPRRIREGFLSGSAPADGLWVVAVARSAIRGARAVDVETEMQRVLQSRTGAI